VPWRVANPVPWAWRVANPVPWRVANPVPWRVANPVPWRVANPERGAFILTTKTVTDETNISQLSLELL